MFTRSDHLPSLEAPCARDDRVLTTELPLVATKQQIAIVRTLVDELERCLIRGHDATTIRDQLVHELTRLGSRSLEIAGEMIEEADGEGQEHPTGDRAVVVPTTD